jgi:hypothetical protein
LDEGKEKFNAVLPNVVKRMDKIKDDISYEFRHTLGFAGYAKEVENRD